MSLLNTYDTFCKYVTFIYIHSTFCKMSLLKNYICHFLLINIFMGAFFSAPQSLYVGGFDSQWDDERVRKFLSDRCRIKFTDLKRDSDKKHFIIKFDNQDLLEKGELLLRKIRIQNSGLKIIRIENNVENARAEMNNMNVVRETFPNSDIELLTPFLNIPYAVQLRNKELANLAEMTEKFNSQYPNITVIPSPILNSYYNRCVLSIGYNQSKKPEIGFQSGNRTSPYIIPIENVSSYPLEIFTIVNIFKNLMHKTKTAPYDPFTGKGHWCSLSIQCSESDMIIYIESKKEISKDLQKEILSAFQQYNHICIKGNNISSTLKGDLMLHQKIHNIDFHFNNSIIIPKNILAIQDMLKYLNDSLRVLGVEDLISVNSQYGFIALNLANSVKNLICFDGDKVATDHAIKTAEQNGIQNVEFSTDIYGEGLINMLSSKNMYKTAVLIEFNRHPSFADTIVNIFNWRPLYVILVSEGSSIPKEYTLFADGYLLFDSIVTDFSPHTNRSHYTTILRLNLNEV